MGTCIAWSSPASPLLQLPPDQDGFNLTKGMVSWVGSLMPVGALIGGQVGGLFMSKFGRKGGMMIASVMFSLSLLFLAAASDVAMIYVGRVCCGVCTGIVCILCPTYVAEISTPNNRGFLGSMVQIMVTIGVLQVIAVGAYPSWRWLTIACLAMCLLWVSLIFFIPESPVHLISRRQYAEAREALEWLRGTNEVELEYEEIVRGVEATSGVSTSFFEVLKPGNLAPFLISLSLMVGQQLSGMNAVMFYAVDIFNDAGSGLKSVYASIIIAVVQVISTVAAGLVMDKLGRRILLCVSAFFMMISISLLGMYFYIADVAHDDSLAHELSVLPVVSLSLFVSMFSIGFGPIPWLMMSELFSPEVKSVASSAATTTNWTLAFIVTKFFQDMVSGVGEAGAFWIFGGCLAVIFIFCLLFVPETKGKSLEEIQLLFRSPDNRAYYLGVWPWTLCWRGAEDTRPFIRDTEN